MSLSERQKNILHFIARFLDQRSFPPTIREIGQAVGISSTSVVKYNLTKLEKEELILRQKEVSRGLSLNWEKLAQLGMSEEMGGPVTYGEANGGHNQVKEQTMMIPIFGPIAAGLPIGVETQEKEMAEDRIELNRSFFRKNADLFALRVQGDSMVDASVLDGDIVILRQQERAENGEMVAAWIEDAQETTLKRFYLKGDKVELHPCNPNYNVQTYNAGQVRIAGKVVSVIRSLE